MAPSNPGQPPSRNVLVVEDEVDVRDALVCLLELEGFEPLVAGNGAEALVALAQHEAPCVILLDLMMPVLDGFGFLVALHERFPVRAPPTLVLTARELSAEDRQRLNRGVVHVLQKGALSSDALLATVREMAVALVAGPAPASKGPD